MGLWPMVLPGLHGGRVLGGRDLPIDHQGLRPRDG